jgi:hypothetical protein
MDPGCHGDTDAVGRWRVGETAESVPRGLVVAGEEEDREEKGKKPLASVRIFLPPPGPPWGRNQIF